MRAAPRAQLSQQLVVAGCTRGLGCPNIQGFILITTARGQIILTCRCILESEGRRVFPSRSLPPFMVFAARKSSPTAASI